MTTSSTIIVAFVVLIFTLLLVHFLSTRIDKYLASHPKVKAAVDARLEEVSAIIHELEKKIVDATTSLVEKDKAKKDLETYKAEQAKLLKKAKTPKVTA